MGRFKDFKEWVRELRRRSREFIVLVEGKRDILALRKYGIRNIMDLSGKRFADIPDMLEGKTRGVILLFDLDDAGERINSNMKEILSSQGFEVDEDFREYLREMGVENVEDIKEYGS